MEVLRIVRTFVGEQLQADASVRVAPQPTISAWVRVLAVRAQEVVQGDPRQGLILFADEAREKRRRT